MIDTKTYFTPSPLQPLEFQWAKERNLRFFVKRDDLIHEAVSGNKWRKLKFNVLQTKQANKSGILTFGGAFSNHILATAHACKTNSLQSLAIIRGDELNKNSNPILQQCSEWGMQFIFVSREEYTLKDDYEYLNELKDEYRAYQIVPEGGKNFLGMVGCQEIIGEINVDFNDIWLAQGTCTTSIGLALSCQSHQLVHGVPVLKGFDAIAETQQLMLRQGLGQDTVEDVLANLLIHDQYHFGGYGKTTEELLAFIEKMEREHQLPLDPVYTGKSFFAMLDHYQSNDEVDKTIVFLHTGGLMAGAYKK